MAKVADNKCPSCGHFSNHANSLEQRDAVPVEGDLSICVNCVEFLQFGEGLVLMKMPESVFDDIDPESLKSLLETRRLILGIPKTH